jgi:DnaJ-class molecular chaperone
MAGDLYIRLNVIIPRHLTEEELKLFTRLKEINRKKTGSHYFLPAFFTSLNLTEQTTKRYYTNSFSSAVVNAKGGLNRLPEQMSK